MYKKIYEVGNKRQTGKENTHLIHLWTDEGYEKIEWENYAYKECREDEAKFKGLNGEPLLRTHNWDRNTTKLHFGDISAHQKFLIEKYGTDDRPSTTCREVFFDIECEMGGALTEEYISTAPKPITSIAWYDKQLDQWAIVILDKKGILKRTKAKNKEIIPFRHEADLLDCFLSRMEEIEPDMLVGYNSDYFDIPYLYYRMSIVLGDRQAKRLSPIGITKHAKNNQYWYKKDMYVDIAGVESMDYMRLHKKYGWEDEPSWKLDAIGEKYVGINKIEYEGTLDDLFETDIQKFIQYNFVDVEILVELDKKLQYLSSNKKPST
jgi:DNA polymerase elongation subunit (family B)